MSNKHLIWSSDIGTLDDWKDAIYDALINDLSGLDNDWRDSVVAAAWYEKVENNADYYDNMLVKDFKAAKEKFYDEYDYQPDVDAYIEENEDKCYDYIVDLNNSYIEDVQINCSDIQPKGRICIFGDFITWNGSKMVAAIPDELVDVSACFKKDGYLKTQSTDIEYCIENGDFVCYEAHHDSDTNRNKYYFRVFPADMTEEDIEEVFDKVNKTKKFDAVFEATESLAPGICKVYGWDYEPNEYDVIQPEQGNGRK